MQSPKPGRDKTFFFKYTDSECTKGETKAGAKTEIQNRADTQTESTSISQGQRAGIRGWE